MYFSLDLLAISWNKFTFSKRYCSILAPSMLPAELKNMSMYLPVVLINIVDIVIVILLLSFVIVIDFIVNVILFHCYHMYT